MARPTPTEARDLLSRSALFHGVPRDDLDALASRARVQTHGAGDLIMRKGEEGDSMMIVIDGRVKIASLSEDGGEMILNIVRPREIFGEMAVLDGGERCADAIAVEDTEVLVLSRAVLRDFLLRHPEMALDLMSVLCKRIRDTTALAEDTVFLDFPARFLRRLETLAEVHGAVAGPTGLRIDHDLSQQHLAESIGVTRESVNKILASWKGKGLVDHGRGWIVIRDMAALVSEVRGPRPPSSPRDE